MRHADRWAPGYFERSLRQPPPDESFHPASKLKSPNIRLDAGQTLPSGQTREIKSSGGPSRRATSKYTANAAVFDPSQGNPSDIRHSDPKSWRQKPGYARMNKVPS